jgi:nucleotide-binding universal stress UspA family protein
MDVQRITVGISGHEPEGTKLAIACRYARAFDAELVFLHVNDPKAGAMAFVDHGVKFDPAVLQRYVTHHAGGPSLPDRCSCEVHTGDWLEELRNASKQSDLLILGHKHTHWLQSALSDSLDEMVINRAHCPVLVVPDKLEA